MKTWQWLGYLGLTPFIICLLFPTLIISDWVISTDEAFTFYSAIILSFLSGTLWRTKSASNTRTSTVYPQLMSNIFCLLAYLCLFLPFKLSIPLLSFGYLGLLITEYALSKSKINVLSPHYLTMRFALTFIVIGLHVILFVSIT